MICSDLCEFVVNVSHVYVVCRPMLGVKCVCVCSWVVLCCICSCGGTGSSVKDLKIGVTHFLRKVSEGEQQHTTNYSPTVLTSSATSGSDSNMTRSPLWLIPSSPSSSDIKESSIKNESPYRPILVGKRIQLFSYFKMDKVIYIILKVQYYSIIIN